MAYLVQRTIATVKRELKGHVRAVGQAVDTGRAQVYRETIVAYAAEREEWLCGGVVVKVGGIRNIRNLYADYEKLYEGSSHVI